MHLPEGPEKKQYFVFAGSGRHRLKNINMHDLIWGVFYQCVICVLYCISLCLCMHIDLRLLDKRMEQQKLSKKLQPNNSS